MNNKAIEKIIKGTDFNFSAKNKNESEIKTNQYILTDSEGKYRLVAKNVQRTRWALYEKDKNTGNYLIKDKDILGVSLEHTIKNLNIEILKIKTAKDLWKEIEDVPMNPETECIETDWNNFKAGTSKEEIWHWFENNFKVSVAEDLMYEEEVEEEIER